MIHIHERYKAIFWEATADTMQLVYISADVERVFGYPASDWLNPSFWGSLLHPEDRTSVITFGRSALAAGKHHDFEYRLRRSDGTYAWVRDASERRGSRIFGTLIDISRERANQEALQNSETRFRKFFQEDQSIKLLIDAKTGRIADANQSALDFYGYTLPEIQNLRIQDINTLTEDEVNEEIRRAQLNERRYFNFKHRLKNGDVRQVEVYSTPIEVEGTLYLHSVIHDVTEIEQTTEALRQSEERYRSITEYAPIGIVVHVNERISYANAEALRILEANGPDEVIGKPTLSFVDQSFRGLVSGRAERLYEKQYAALEPSDQILFSCRGNRKECLITSIAIQYKGQPAIYTVFSDLTERRKAERKSRENEHLYRLLAENSTDFISLHDANFCYLYLSPNFSQLGYTPEALMGQSPEMHIHPDDRKRVRERLDEVDVLRYRILHQEGHFLWVESKTRRIHDPIQDREVRLMVTRDVDDRIKMEQALEHSRAILTTTFEKSTDALFLVDRTGKIKEYNERVIELFELESPDELLNTLGEDLEVWSSVSLIEVRRILSERSFILNRQVQYCTRKGNLFWGNFAARRFNIESEGYTLVVVTDISRLKQIEQQLEERYEAEQMLNAQLTTQNEELSRTNTELDTFVYRVSHDLRAPLTSAMGLIHIATNTREIDEIYRYLQLQNKSLQKLDDFIQEIVHYSRNARLEIVPTRIDFRQMIAEIWEQLRFADHRLNCEIEIVDEQTDFYTDDRRLNIILSNLLSNAIRYAHPYRDQPCVRVCVQISAGEARLDITDNGQGIKADYLDKIFDMFFRATDRGQGSGLGLYIVKEAIRKLHGTIEVSSTFDVGTTFEVRLPNLQ
ncbi:MAG: PAS domain S-box protein [Bernardetiaceae bacterium]